MAGYVAACGVLLFLYLDLAGLCGWGLVRAMRTKKAFEGDEVLRGKAYNTFWRCSFFIALARCVMFASDIVWATNDFPEGNYWGYLEVLNISCGFLLVMTFATLLVFWVYMLMLMRDSDDMPAKFIENITIFEAMALVLIITNAVFQIIFVYFGLGYLLYVIDNFILGSLLVFVSSMFAVVLFFLWQSAGEKKQQLMSTASKQLIEITSLVSLLLLFRGIFELYDAADQYPTLPSYQQEWWYLVVLYLILELIPLCLMVLFQTRLNENFTAPQLYSGHLPYMVDEETSLRPASQMEIVDRDKTPPHDSRSFVPPSSSSSSSSAYSPSFYQYSGAAKRGSGENEIVEHEHFTAQL